MDGGGFSLSSARVAIVGLGLMGGSLAMALQGKCAALLGVDADPAAVAAALRRGIVAVADTDPARLLPGADVLILAVPVPAILSLLDRLPGLVSTPCILFDLGSSKQAIVSAMDRLPARFDALGGHPLCGRERLSLENASPDLYCAAPFLLTPAARTSARACACAEQVALAAGARPLWMDSAAHDAALAATSHLPYLMASALCLATPAGMDGLCGPGFRSAGRLAATPASMMLGVLRTNRTNVLAAAARLRASLAQLESALEQDDPQALDALLGRARDRYTEMIP